MMDRARIAVVLRRLDAWTRNRAARRPGRTMRLLALAVLLVFISELPAAQDFHDYVWAVWSLMFMSFIAVAPKGFYDGRFERWSGEHPGPSAALLGGFTVFLALAFLSDHFTPSTSLLIAAAIGLVLGVVNLERLRRSRRKADEGSASGVDGGPSSR